MDALIVLDTALQPRLAANLSPWSPGIETPV